MLAPAGVTNFAGMGGLGGGSLLNPITPSAAAAAAAAAASSSKSLSKTRLFVVVHKVGVYTDGWG